MANKQELEQQLNEAIGVAQRLNGEIKTLRTENDRLKEENSQLRNDFDAAADRVRTLANQLKMLESERQARTKYSDISKNY
jgi:predicted nuclease with TOPRIM domain